MSTTPSVLVLCTANRVRSPLAAAMLVQRCAEQGVAVDVSSAGLMPGGHPADSTAQVAGAEVGLDLSGHVSREVTREMLRAADLVVVMTRDHLRQLAVLEPSSFARTFTLRELARLVVALSRSGTPLRQRVVALSAGRTARGFLGEAPDDDVADPMGGPIEGYRDLVADLAVLLTPLVPALAAPCGPRRPRARSGGHRSPCQHNRRSRHRQPGHPPQRRRRRQRPRSPASTTPARDAGTAVDPLTGCAPAPGAWRVTRASPPPPA